MKCARPTIVSINGQTVTTNYYTGVKLDSTVTGTNPQRVTAFTFDSRGRPLTVTDPETHQRTITYEPSGAQNTYTVTQTGGGGAGTTTFAYDAHGREQSVSDRAGRVFSTNYDALNRVTSTTAPGTVIVGYAYDDVNRRVTVTDPRGLAYTATTNALGWVTSQTLPGPTGPASESLTYDANGNVASYTNRRGIAVTYSYDQFDRVTQQNAEGKLTNFAYDSLERWVSISNDESTDTLTLDLRSRPDEMISWRNNVRYVIKTSYNDEGLHNVTKATGPWGSSSMALGYDATLRLGYVGDMASRGTSIGYNRDDLPSTITLPTGTTAQTKLVAGYTWTSMHRPLAITYNQLAQPTLGRGYRYDVLERISKVGRGISSDSVIRTVGYDPLGRVSSYNDTRRWSTTQRVCPTPQITSCYDQVTWNTSVLRSDSYTYDNSGNRTDHSASLVAGTNRLSSFDGYTMQYDADGNMTSRTKAGTPTMTLEWNAVGQMVKATVGASVTTYGYDGWGRRVRKTVDGVVTRYLHDGDDLVMELNGAGSPIREYTYYPGTDNPHSVRRSSDGAIFYYTTEQIGHVTGLVNATNAIVNKYEYTPFGGTITATEQVAQPLRYTAREYDAETGLYYYRARYYDSALSRFVSEDPLGIGGGMNAYAYVANDPMNSGDPNGLCPYTDSYVSRDGTRLCADGSRFAFTLPAILSVGEYDPFEAFKGINDYVDGLMKNTEEFMRSVKTAAEGASVEVGGMTFSANLSADCGWAVASLGANAVLDFYGGKALLSAVGGGAKAAAWAARSWNPSLVRELGIAFAGVVQRKAMNASGSYAVPAAVGLLDYTADGLRMMERTGDTSLLNFVPWYGTFQAGKSAVNACVNVKR